MLNLHTLHPLKLYGFFLLIWNLKPDLERARQGASDAIDTTSDFCDTALISALHCGDAYDAHARIRTRMHPCLLPWHISATLLLIMVSELNMRLTSNACSCPLSALRTLSPSPVSEVACSTAKLRSGNAGASAESSLPGQPLPR